MSVESKGHPRCRPRLGRWNQLQVLSTRESKLGRNQVGKSPTASVVQPLARVDARLAETDKVLTSRRFGMMLALLQAGSHAKDG